MKVLQVSIGYYGGGAERCARDLHDALTARGVEMHMAVANEQANVPDNIHVIRTAHEKLLFPLNFLPTLNDWRHRGSIRFFDKLTTRDYDVVHLHNLHGNWLSLRAVQRLSERIPTVWTLHDAWSVTAGLVHDVASMAASDQVARVAGGGTQKWPLVHNRATRRQAPALQAMLRKQAIIAAPSRYMVELARACPWMEGCPVEHLPYALRMLERNDLDLPVEAARTSWGLPADRPVILLVAANMTMPIKGTVLALEALEQVARELPPERRPAVLLLGRNPEDMVARLEPDFTVCTGYAAEDEALVRAYRAATVTLIPSLAENFPYVGLESFACATPIACFSVGGLTEMAGDNERGIRVTPYHVGEFAQAMVDLVSDAPRRDALGAAGRAWSRQICEPQRVFDRTLELYEQARSSAQPS